MVFQAVLLLTVVICTHNYDHILVLPWIEVFSKESQRLAIWNIHTHKAIRGDSSLIKSISLFLECE